MMKIRTLIVDDEPLAVESLRALLAAEPEIEIIGDCFNGGEAVSAIRSMRPHLVLLDVQMPVLDGFEVIEALEPEEIPVVVFITAFDEYAVQAFTVHAVDYLLKPVEPERFRDALHHVRQILAGKCEREENRKLLSLLRAVEPQRGMQDRLVIREGGRTIFIRAQEVDAIEAAGVYAVLHRGSESFVLREALSGLEVRLNRERFLRTHRSWIVNADRVVEIRANGRTGCELLLSCGLAVPLSRRHRTFVLSRLGDNKR